MSDTTAKPPLKLECHGVRKSFGPKHVLRGVDIKVSPGESLVIIGGSGSGKSVTLKCMLGILQPDAGDILIDGFNIVKASEKERHRRTNQIGMLFQGGALFDSLPVWENVAFRLLNAEKVARSEAKERAVVCLRKVGLSPEVGELSPAELSGGMQKRVGLARAIVSEPEVIFFDEPTTGLDPIMADVINDLIVEQVRGLGAAAVSITHDMASARKIADRVAMIYRGEIIWEGAASDLDDSGNPMVDQFVNGRAKGPIEMDLLKA
ncbi:MAG: ATP-binding cassette domain-containing protein [Pseudomonadota bacterium]